MKNCESTQGVEAVKEVLQEGERVDHTPSKKPIIQHKNAFAFSIDSVLLAYFCSVPKTIGKIIDLGTGNGIIPLLLTERSRVPVTGIERQPELCDMAARTMAMNEAEGQVTVQQADVRTVRSKYHGDQWSLVTCNPPYFDTGRTAMKNKQEKLANARHEEHGSLEEFVRTAAFLAKQKGKVAMVLRPERLAELLSYYQKYRIEPKRMQFVHPKAERAANMVMVEGMKAGRPGLECLPPIVVYNENGQYTEEFRAYYGTK
jgi:tRNA1(Val) A37 N6-methylase TrmN6